MIITCFCPYRAQLPQRIPTSGRCPGLWAYGLTARGYHISLSNATLKGVRLASYLPFSIKREAKRFIIATEWHGWREQDNKRQPSKFVFSFNSLLISSTLFSIGWFYKLPPHIVIKCLWKYVLLSFGFFLVQNVSSFSRVARYTPSLSCILTSKISSKSNKANL